MDYQYPKRRGQNGVERISEEMMSENIPNLEKYISLQIQEAWNKEDFIPSSIKKIHVSCWKPKPKIKY